MYRLAQESKGICAWKMVHVNAEYGLRQRVIETVFESHILTGAVINSKHPRRFIEDVSEIILEHVHSVMQHVMTL